jgi:hypothetical protein
MPRIHSMTTTHRLFFLEAILFFLLPACCIAQDHVTTGDAALKTFLRSYLKKPDVPFENAWPTQYSSAIADLSDDGAKDVIVYVTGRGWCGTGGCLMLVLAPEGNSYRVVTKTTVVYPPIRVLSKKSNGWHDITVIAQINAMNRFETLLRFNGKTYPTNPTVPPARKLDLKADGRTLISTTTKGERLYD